MFYKSVFCWKLNVKIIFVCWNKSKQCPEMQHRPVLLSRLSNPSQTDPNELCIFFLKDIDSR